MSKQPQIKKNVNLRGGIKLSTTKYHWKELGLFIYRSWHSVYQQSVWNYHLQERKAIYLSIWDLATEGSPINNMLISLENNTIYTLTKITVRTMKCLQNRTKVMLVKLLFRWSAITKCQFGWNKLMKSHFVNKVYFSHHNIQSQCVTCSNKHISTFIPKHAKKEQNSGYCTWRRYTVNSQLWNPT